MNSKWGKWEHRQEKAENKVLLWWRLWSVLIMCSSSKAIVVWFDFLCCVFFLDRLGLLHYHLDGLQNDKHVRYSANTESVTPVSSGPLSISRLLCFTTGIFQILKWWEGRGTVYTDRAVCVALMKWISRLQQHWKGKNMQVSFFFFFLHVLILWS